MSNVKIQGINIFQLLQFSQLLDIERDPVYSPTNGFASRVKNFLGYGTGSSPLTSLRRRARSLNVLDRGVNYI